MIIEGSCELKTSLDKTWEYIIDPAKIGKCLPDLKSLNVESENKFAAVIRVGVGPIRSEFKFRIEITGKEPPHRVQLKAVGSGSGSNVNIDVAIDIKEVLGGCQLVYKADVKIGGMMAGLGQRVIMDAASKTVASVFSCIKREIEQA